MVLDHARLLRKHFAACAVIAVTTASFAANTGNTAVNDANTDASARVTPIALPFERDAAPVSQPATASTASTATPSAEMAAPVLAVAADAAPAIAVHPDAMTPTAVVAPKTASEVVRGVATAPVDAIASELEPMQLAGGVKHTYKPVAMSSGAAAGSAGPGLKSASYIPPARATEEARNFRGIRLVAGSALAVDALSGETLYYKNPDRTMPIASITKLMTAMVVLDAKLPMQEILSIGPADVDRLKHTTSRLPVGTKLNRQEMLRLALMSSENRAASALARHYPGGRTAFLNAMRRKAAALGMADTRFNDSTGLTPTNVSTARDLVKMVRAASQYPLIRRFTTTAEHRVRVATVRHPLDYRNTNRLVRGGHWNISVSKTGFINEAGHCLVMMANVGKRPVAMVFLQTPGKLTPLGDATRLRNWVEAGGANLTVARNK